MYIVHLLCILKIMQDERESCKQCINAEGGSKHKLVEL